jgi:hypothetical protein
MIKDELVSYTKIFGISVLSVIKFAAAGIAINWVYGLFKIFWYIELFKTGGWWAALAVGMILLLFIGIPALYIYMGYQHAIANAIIKVYNKNREFITGMVTRVTHRVAGVKQITQGTTAVAGGTNEHRIVRFLMRNMGYAAEWEQLANANTIPDEAERKALVESVLTKVITSLPQKIAEGFTYNLRKVILGNLVVLLFIEIFSRFYPA